MFCYDGIIYSRSISAISKSNKPYVPPQIDVLTSPIALLQHQEVSEGDRIKKKERERERERERETQRQR